MIYFAGGATHLPTLRALEAFTETEGELGDIARELFPNGLKPLAFAPDLEIAFRVATLLSVAPRHLRIAMISQIKPPVSAFFVEHWDPLQAHGVFVQTSGSSLEVSRVTLKNGIPELESLSGILQLPKSKPEFNWSQARDGSWEDDPIKDKLWTAWLTRELTGRTRDGHDPTDMPRLLHRVILHDLATISMLLSPLYVRIDAAADSSGRLLMVSEPGKA